MTNGITIDVPVVYPLRKDPDPELDAGQDLLALGGMEDVVDQLRTMLFQEKNGYPICEAYLRGSATTATSTATATATSTSTATAARGESDQVTESWRRRLCEWIFEVVDHFGFEREVVPIALDYLDRSVSATTRTSSKVLSKREFQLFAVTSLYIAIKLHGETDTTEGPRLKMKITAFQELSRGFFSTETIEAMERYILTTLGWRVNPPTSIFFVSYLIRLLPSWSAQEYGKSYEETATRIFEVAKYLTELSCFDSSFTFRYKQSAVAYASIMCAIDSIQDTSPLPYEIYIQFLHNITVATKVLLPGMEGLMQVKTKLKSLAPSLFALEPRTLTRTVSIQDTEEVLNSSSSSCSAVEPTHRRGSPVCVCMEADGDDGHDDATAAMMSSRRKRLKTSQDSP